MSRVRQTARTGIIGAGYIAQWHAKALRGLDNVDLVAVADCHVERAKVLAARNGIPRIHKNYEDMLEVEDLDVVHLLVPPELHARIAEACLGRHVDVFLEKPMGATVAECEALTELAAQQQCQIGVNHNYLFYPAYERLRSDVREGNLGAIEQVTVVWNRPLGQLGAGPYHLWMFQHPANILIETGPHSIAHALDLAGIPESISVRPRDPIMLPNRNTIYRRWSIAFDGKNCDVDLKFSYKPGYIEHYVHVRGSHGSAHADLEDNLYTLRRPGALSIDLDRYQRVRQEARELGRQASRNLGSYVWGRIGMGRSTNPFGESIRRSAAAFYATRRGPLEERVAATLGTDVLRLCEVIRDHVNGLPAHPRRSVESPTTEAAAVPTEPSVAPKILVLGGSGFIGRELVKQLVDQGHAVRVLSRDLAGISAELEHPLVELVRGDAGQPESVRDALNGITHVYHLVTGRGETWDDYLRSDVVATEQVAQLCLTMGITRFIYAGTIASLYSGRRAGVINGASRPDAKLETRNHYARAKGLAEIRLLWLHEKEGLPVIILRPGIVVGAQGSPYHWGVCMWPNETACRFWGSGDNPLPFVLVEDVASAFVKALDAPDVLGRAFNLVGDVQLSAREYVEELQNCSGVRFDARPHAIWKYYAADVTKWMVKTAIGHPERKPPSYRDWETRQELGKYDCHDVKECLNWQPNADRQRLVEQGIHTPMRRSMA